MKGIDVSSNQGNINFNYVAQAGYEVVIIKATEGLNYINPLLITHYNAAKKAGLKVGFYHFMRANNPLDEAQHFLEAISQLQSDCKYVIDCETTENQTSSAISSRVRAFADYLTRQGKDPCLYTGESFYHSYMNDTVRNIPLWIAHYGVPTPNVQGWVGFQYSETGAVPGIFGNVDLDVFTDGILLKSFGWFKGNDGFWYCYENGNKVKNAWRKDSVDWCYLNENGQALVNGWAQDSSKKWFYCGSNCRIVRNTWVDWKGKKYWFNGEGEWVEGKTE